jgi:hypothetical protein
MCRLGVAVDLRGDVVGPPIETASLGVWEVEVCRPDGSSTDVRLEADDRVVTVEPDAEGRDADGS